jgi:hypothetical protein
VSMGGAQMTARLSAGIFHAHLSAKALEAGGDFQSVLNLQGLRQTAEEERQRGVAHCLSSRLELGMHCPLRLSCLTAHCICIQIPSAGTCSRRATAIVASGNPANAPRTSA